MCVHSYVHAFFVDVCVPLCVYVLGAYVQTTPLHPLPSGSPGLWLGLQIIMDMRPQQLLGMGLRWGPEVTVKSWNSAATLV